MHVRGLHEAGYGGSHNLSVQLMNYKYILVYSMYTFYFVHVALHDLESALFGCVYLLYSFSVCR